MAELVSCLLQEIEGVAESDGESVASLEARHVQQPADGGHAGGADGTRAGSPASPLSESPQLTVRRHGRG